MDQTARYFEPVSRVQLASKMRHLLRFSDLMLLIVGAGGSGKTTLLRQLEADERTADVRQALISCEETVDVTRLLSTLVAALAVDCPDGADNRTRLRALHAYSRSLHESGIPLLLLIDDADYLTNNAVELLTNFALLDEGAPRVVLTGNQEFEQRFIANGFDQLLDGRLHVQQLNAFEPEEAAEFIETLLPPGTELPDRKMRRLIEESQGLPGRLTAGVRRQIHQGGVTRSGARALPISGLYLAAIGVVLLAILGASIWLYLPEPEGEPEPEQVTRVVMPIDIPAAAVDETVPVVDVRSELQQKLAEQERRLESETAQTDGSVDKGADESARVSPTEAVGVEAAEPKVATDDRTAVPQSPEMETDLAEERPQPIPAIEVDKPQVAAVEQAPKQTPAASAAPAAKPVTGSKQPAKTENQGVKVALRSEELLQWPDKGYTLQLLGAREAASVEQFITAQPNPERFYYFRTIYKGAPWHVVVYGQFSDRASAMAAVQTLPESLRKLRPWARSIAGVKSDIRK